MSYDKIPGLSVHDAMAMMSSGWSEVQVGAIHCHAVQYRYSGCVVHMNGIVCLKGVGRSLVLHPLLSEAWPWFGVMEALPPGTPVHAWTDGSGLPTDASVGCAAVLRWMGPGGQRQEVVSLSLGKGTNNVAEIRGIQLALSCVPRTDLTLLVRSDSEYGIGSMTLPWHAKKNVDLVAEARTHLALRPATLEHVRGHSGDAMNELADRAAGAARRKK